LQLSKLLPAVGSPHPAKEEEQHILLAVKIRQANLAPIARLEEEVGRFVADSEKFVFAWHLVLMDKLSPKL